MTESFVKRISPAALPALWTGVLVGTAYIPSLPLAILFCLVPLWSSWTRARNARQVFWSGWLAQAVLTLIGFHWVAHTAVEFGHFPWPVGILVLLGFSAHANLHFPLAGLAWWYTFRKSRSSKASIMGLAAWTALLELILPQIFAWNFGYPLFYAKLPVFQLTDIFGFTGLSAIVILTNGLLLIAWRSPQRIRHFGTLLAGVLALNLAGYLWSKRILDQPVKPLDVLFVQANIGNFEKFAAETNSDYRTPIIQKFFELTRRGIQEQSPVDLIIWPETAFPSNLHPSVSQGFFGSQLRSFITANQIPLVTGAYMDEPQGDYFNTLMSFDKDGQNTGIYKKVHLLAFGEYFPGAKYFPVLKDLIPAISEFGRGQGPEILEVAGVKFGGQICYEGLFPDHSRGAAKLGAQALINVTNDSWFGHFFESKQHLFMTLGRAVEFRIPVLRSTNTGITSAASALGEVLLLSPQEVEWTGKVSVPIPSTPIPTIYSKWGYYLPYGAVLLILIVSMVWLIKQKEGRNDTDPS